MCELTFSPSTPGIPGGPSEPWEINAKAFRSDYITHYICIAEGIGHWSLMDFHTEIITIKKCQYFSKRLTQHMTMNVVFLSVYAMPKPSSSRLSKPKKEKDIEKLNKTTIKGQHIRHKQMWD